MAILKRATDDVLVLLNGRAWNEVVDRLNGIQSQGKLTGGYKTQSPIGGIVEGLNSTGSVFEQGSPVKIGDPLTLPGDQEDDLLFRNSHKFNLEAVDADSKKVGICFFAIGDDRVGSVVLIGPATALINVESLDHEYAQPNDAGQLETTSKTTLIRVLYSPEVGEQKLCKVLLGGSAASTGTTYAVSLEHDGGADGTAEASASWTYSVRLFNEEEILQAQVNPGVAPHEYRRGIGKRTKATSGIATNNSDGDMVILTTNETIVFSTCEPEPEP